MARGKHPYLKRPGLEAAFLMSLPSWKFQFRWRGNIFFPLWVSVTTVKVTFTDQTVIRPNPAVAF